MAGEWLQGTLWGAGLKCKFIKEEREASTEYWQKGVIA